MNAESKDAPGVAAGDVFVAPAVALFLVCRSNLRSVASMLSNIQRHCVCACARACVCCVCVRVRVRARVRVCMRMHVHVHVHVHAYGLVVWASHCMCVNGPSAHRMSMAVLGQGRRTRAHTFRCMGVGG